MTPSGWRAEGEPAPGVAVVCAFLLREAFVFQGAAAPGDTFVSWAGVNEPAEGDAGSDPEDGEEDAGDIELYGVKVRLTRTLLARHPRPDPAATHQAPASAPPDPARPCQHPASSTG